MYYQVQFDPEGVITIQADNLDQAWDKATKLGKVLNIVPT
jgi:hypothetical protein